MAFTPRLPAPDMAALLLLPLSVLAGGALFWPAACLVAIGAALGRQHLAMLVWYGLAVGFDAQALLVAPLFIALAIGRRIPPAVVAVAPASALAMLLTRTLGTPFRPTLLLPQDLMLNAGAPNIWAIVRTLPWVRDLSLTGLALTAAIGTAAAYAAWCSARPLAGRALLDAALLCGLVLPELMPALGTGAFLLADGLAIVLAVASREPRRWHIAGLVLGGTLIGHAGGADLAPLGAVGTILATVLHARAVLKPAANDNPLMARTACRSRMRNDRPI